MQNKAFYVLLIDSVYRKDKNCYLKVFSENCSFNDSYNEGYDEEYFGDSDNSYEKILSKKIRMKKIKCIDSF